MDFRGNDKDWMLFELRQKLKLMLREKVEITKLNEHILITVAFNWHLHIEFEAMDDLIDNMDTMDSLRAVWDRDYKQLITRKANNH